MLKNNAPLFHVPNYLNQADLPWLQRVLNEYGAMVGFSNEQLKKKFTNPAHFGAPPKKFQITLRVLGQLFPKESVSDFDPIEVREFIFLQSAEMMKHNNYPSNETGETVNVENIKKNVWKAFVNQEKIKTKNLDLTQIENLLFADLDSQKKILSPPQTLSLPDLIPQINLALVQTILFYADQLELHLVGYSRTILKYAKLKGLICQIFDSDNHPYTAKIIISGPISLFHKTLVYGRAFSGLLPLLPWSHSFKLNVRCVLNQKPVYYWIDSSHPIAASKNAQIAKGKWFDSKVEEKFYTDFVKLSSDWNLIFEPTPFVWGNQGLVFPDFLLQHQRILENRWYLEIVAFYTSDYFKQKAVKYLQAPIPNLIICVIESKNLERDLFKSFPHVFYFKRKINPQPILELIQS